MNKITEISRRTMMNNESGIACGPCGTLAIDAEIVVEDNDKKVFLHGQWVSDADDMVLFEATKESIYDVNFRINNSEGDLEENLTRRDWIGYRGIDDWFPDIDIKKRYKQQYDALIEMIKAEWVNQGYEDDILSDDQEEV